jgi:hypothetical protein
MKIPDNLLDDELGDNTKDNDFDKYVKKETYNFVLIVVSVMVVTELLIITRSIFYCILLIGIFGILYGSLIIKNIQMINDVK